MPGCTVTRSLSPAPMFFGSVFPTFTLNFMWTLRVYCSMPHREINHAHDHCAVRVEGQIL
jgi:hypothetical protein